MSPLSPTGSLSPQTLPGVAVQELGSGIDLLHLSGDTRLPDGFLAQLMEARQRAVNLGGPVGFTLGGIERWETYPLRLAALGTSP